MATKSTSRQSPRFRCAECGWTTAKWVGRCGECQAWGTVAETAGGTAPRTVPAQVLRPATPIAEVDLTSAAARPTGVAEFDRVLGGGLVPGAVVLVAGEPGIGKSTLLLDVAARAARQGAQTLYVSGEESAAQVRARADRIDALADRLYLAAETDLATVLGHVEASSPQLLVVDSVQTIASADVEGQAGNVSQVREVAASLIRMAKDRGMSVLLVGHVTKDGSIAGPRVLEHLVDVVVQFEGDRHSRLRLVRAVKNRYGPTDEVGCFDLSETGIIGLPDPSGLFLSHRLTAVAGTCVTVTLEGRRPLVTEVQALVAPSTLPSPRRTSSGLDASRLAMVIAVLDKRAGAPVGAQDIFAATVGGVRVTEPAADLALVCALASSVLDRPLPVDAIAIGEVGLAGEVRRATGIGRRLTEAARLGFRHAVVPRGSRDDSPMPDGINVIEVSNVAEAIETMRRLAVAQPTPALARDTA
ncbi:DNA repair protein RadA [Intrasporangium calvum]|uniref:DNA repair protein RadA n=1 Tax=Intrasporangium calvum (strain ATCC 23552 / DSM 43043 / JCM 3097 / NBRC 12989 / NCIMB 10167 / NRRL B-3866 / 7 KIP) TaxID=710696 RepID=E6S9Y5_INTC7|nr:DNA repair protein RadA [Intrasporangium calvum]ADU47175.1 DNA repair protein RadA [Intrasporangium calvum DSM 43043]